MTQGYAVYFQELKNKTLNDILFVHKQFFNLLWEINV